MDYFKIYLSIVASRIEKPSPGYKEKHHIIPKCKGGSNDKSNIVALTPREHLVCHKLLARAFNDRSMWFALMMMSREGCRSALGVKVNSRVYEKIRSMTMSFPSPRIGIPLSHDHKRKVSEGSARLSGMDHPMFGRKQTKESKDKMSLNSKRLSGVDHPMYGKKKSPESNAAQSVRVSGKNNPRFDPRIFKLAHLDGRTFTGSRFDFCEHIGAGHSEGCVSRLFNGKQETMKGWRIIKDD